MKSAWELPDGSMQNTYFTCLAVSGDDGITFTKPTLGLVEINGSKANNCVWPPGGALAAVHEPGTVFLDTNPKAPRDERYKMIATWGLCTGCGNGTFTFVSPDGLRFRPVSRGDCSANRLGPCRPSDSLGPASGASGTQHVAFYDHRIEQYVEYRRSYVDYSKPCPWADPQQPWPDGIKCDICIGEHCGKSSPGGRKVNRCTTTDWRLFPNCEFFAESFTPGPVNANTDMVFGTDEHDAPCMDVYTNQVVTYHGHYLAFPSVRCHPFAFLGGPARLSPARRCIFTSPGRRHGTRVRMTALGIPASPTAAPARASATWATMPRVAAGRRGSSAARLAGRASQYSMSTRTAPGTAA